jgi:hypothetical protein
MLSRRKVLKGGAVAAIMAAVPFVRVRQALAQSVSTFDYYISPTGDDNNAGTLASPWSITALNSKWTIYTGKKIGLIAGTYQYGTVGGVQTTLYSLYQNKGVINTYAASVLAINGSANSGSPTYLASCNSSGVYTARAAIIDCSDPSTGNKPTVEGSVMGQWSYQPLVFMPHFGNVTIDGIVIRNFTFSALNFFGSSGAPIAGLTIKNCELYNGGNVVSNNNPGAIFLNAASNATVTNCKIHDLVTTNSGLMLLGFIQFNTIGTTNISNCTFYNCSAISNKDSWQGLNVSYCYLGWGTFGSPYRSFGGGLYSTVQNYVAPTGQTNLFHHNIVIGPVSANGESGQANNGTVKMYNNTFYKPSGLGTRGMDAFTDIGNPPTTGGMGNFQFYNNLIYAADAQYDGIVNSEFPGAFSKYGAITGGTSGTLTSTDYNAYGTGMTFGQSYTSGQYAWNLTTWRGYGYDAHSILLGSNPFTATPSETNSASFAISGPATTAGMGGVPCGALDGSGSVGCNFVGNQPVPDAPSLSVS